jgi:hypothetical protein
MVHGKPDICQHIHNSKDNFKLQICTPWTKSILYQHNLNNYAPGNSSAERIGFNKLSVSTACKSSQRILNEFTTNCST